MSKYIFSFEDLKKEVERMKHNAQRETTGENLYITELYIYMSWLGLTDDEIRNVSVKDYNPQMRVLFVNGRYVYVSEEKIADVLKNIFGHIEGKLIKTSAENGEDELKKADKLAAEFGISHGYIYKMRFFFDKYDYESKNVSEDMMHMTDTIRNLGGNTQELQSEYHDYVINKTMKTVSK